MIDRGVADHVVFTERDLEDISDMFGRAPTPVSESRPLVEKIKKHDCGNADVKFETSRSLSPGYRYSWS